MKFKPILNKFKLSTVYYHSNAKLRHLWPGFLVFIEVVNALYCDLSLTLLDKIKT